MSSAEAWTEKARREWDPASEPLELEDGEIVDRVLRGDTGLYAVLMRRYNRRLYRVVWSILLDETETEDVVQDAYVRALQHLDQFDGRARFSTWLTRIAVYEASARREKRRRMVALDSLEGHTKERLMAANGEAFEDGEARVMAQDLRGLLERAVAALPPPYRQVFVLREVEGLSTAEAANALGLSRTAAKVRLFRARRHLRRELEGRAAAAAGEVLSFAGERCDRIVAGVMVRIA